MSIPIFQVINASGELVDFEQHKLIRSLEKSGAGEESIEKILKEVAKTAIASPTPFSTKSIYKLAYRLLKQKAAHLAARYSLKQAIQDMGPSGYPFEVLISELLEYQGFKTRVGVLMEGRCVTHEVDVLATKGQHVAFVECKFHNDFGRKNDIKTPLYVQSRYLDLAFEWNRRNTNQIWETSGWIASNTQFTDDAITYSRCMNLNLIGWDYPQNGGSLRERIDRAGLHPITCLTGLTKQEKQILMDKKIVLAHHLLENPKALNALNFRDHRLHKVLDEAEKLIDMPVIR